MTDQQVLEAIFELDNDAPALDIANEIGGQVPDVAATLNTLKKEGLVANIGSAFELTDAGYDRLEQITA